jgi:hypothetical protein
MQKLLNLDVYREIKLKTKKYDCKVNKNNLTNGRKYRKLISVDAYREIKLKTKKYDCKVNKNNLTNGRNAEIEC